MYILLILLVAIIIFLLKRYLDLSKYKGIEDVDKEIERKRIDAANIIDKANEQSKEIKNTADTYSRVAAEDRERLLLQAKQEQKDILSSARDKADSIINKSNAAYAAAQREASKIIEDARVHAQNIAGDAFELKEKADELSAIASAMQNKIEGYGNEYIIPNRMLLDDLADNYSYTQASADYKSVVAQMDRLIKTRGAAVCSYAGRDRIEAAIDFCIDAFNGKLSTILTKVKTTNYGILKQELADAYTLVNHLGSGSRSVQITEKYYRLSQEKLRLAATLVEMKEKEKEEQRAIREQMREEERARREIERAIKDAAKQEELLQKAMEKAKEKYETASEEQKAKYEAQLADLEAKLKEAEERNKRAQSMAEQTKRGHVYVISNVGSFGENIYKIGMTRRLEPLDRVKELGDASVPFPFDVHAMIWSEDAPSLETSLHKHFAVNQVNKINFRKEFFNVPIATIREEIEKLGLKNITWTMAAEAREYKETQALERQMQNNPEVKEAWLSKEIKDYAPLMSENDEE